MIKYQTECGVTVNVVDGDDFEVTAYGRDSYFNRKQLTELRAVIDQALNTSAEELGDE